MKTITHNGSNISAYRFADDDEITATEKNIVLADTTEFDDPFIIGDMNTSNSTIHTGVTLPEDWAGGKYLFDGTTWSLNPDWSEPVDLVKQADDEYDASL
tara:strand:+ start:1808 stop:2107 length:300 start_codon:yes stop_codon:yes gene_type:complete